VPALSNLPSKRQPARSGEAEAVPTWRELAERFRELMKDFLREGKPRSRA
jgi:hypothetical protein